MWDKNFVYELTEVGQLFCRRNKEWKGFSRNIKARIAISTISASIPLCADSQSYKKNNGERFVMISVEKKKFWNVDILTSTHSWFYGAATKNQASH